MKANDLMVGDWVYLLKNKSDIHGFEVVDACPRRVTGIHTDGDEPYVQTDDCDVFYDMSAYQPIPLTKETLVANGFDIQEQGGNRYDVWTGFGPDCEGDIEIEFQGSTPIHLKIDGAYKGEYYTSSNIRYVHELQHALRLCGIDKEIVL